MTKSAENNRQELDINIPLVTTLALVLTVLTYAILFPFKNSYLGILLYERGYTQYLVVFLASFVIATTLDKFRKVQTESKKLNQHWIPDNIPFEDPQSGQLYKLWQELIREKSIVSRRFSRILVAYINSGSRKAATELAVDDSSFYLSASESSYALPRILVWAIPLLGFIGTVLGISSAVNGFSTFLENTTEVEQIKQGIGTVTSGLSVAFDTTLLALLLSVVVMIPLVLVERLESKLLLGIDVYLNDNLLPRLTEKEVSPGIAKDILSEIVTKAVKENVLSEEQIIQPIKEAIPNPEELVKPAEIYSQEVAKQLAEIFINQFKDIQSKEAELIKAIQQINQNSLEDREKYMDSFSTQQNLNRAIIEEIQNLVTQVKEHSENLTQQLNQQGLELSKQLNEAANKLENQIEALERASLKVAELTQMQNSLDRMILVLNKTVGMENSLAIIKEQISLLRPALEQIAKPRIITLVEDRD